MMFIGRKIPKSPKTSVLVYIVNIIRSCMTRARFDSRGKVAACVVLGRSPPPPSPYLYYRLGPYTFNG